MGFLSGLSGILGGGSQSSSSGSGQSGFALLPTELQDAWKEFGTAAKSQIPLSNTAYKPLAQTADETRAFDILRQGFAPTQESLNRDVGMLMNPFDNFVINDVNRQANSDFSILKQNLDQAGQFGSNRQQLGANDIEQTRLGTIGKLRQGQYNQALDQVFNGLLPARAADASGLLSIGNFQRGLNTQTNAAPITGLQEIAKALGIIPQSGGSTQTSSSQAHSSQGGTLGNAISTVGTIASLAGMFSDIRLKENIEHVGKENGLNIYEFNYIDDPARYRGVMAHEVEAIDPEAVMEIAGYKAVDYSKIGVEFKRLA